MKKILLILFFTLIALLAGLPWFFGAQLQKRLPDIIAQGAREAERYGLALHLRNYRRGYLTSSAQMLLLYQPPGAQIPLYQGIMTLDIRHAPLLASGFNFMTAHLHSDNDAQGALAQALPDDFLNASTSVGLNGHLHLQGRLLAAHTNLLPHPNRPQHLAFHGARFAVDSTLTGYPDKGRGQLELHGATFTDDDQRWHLQPLHIHFASEERYEAQAHMPELTLQHSLHATAAREQIRIGGFRAQMQQGLAADGSAYPHSLTYHIDDFHWASEQHGETRTQHLRDLALNATLRQNGQQIPNASVNISATALQLDLPGGWQDIAPEHIASHLELEPFGIPAALELLDRLRHPLPDAQYLPLPDSLSHLNPPGGIRRILHYLAARMGKENVRAHWQLTLTRKNEPLLRADLHLAEHINAADSMTLLQELADAINHSARLPGKLHGSRLHLFASAPFVQKSGLGITLLFSGQQRYLDHDKQFKLDGVINENNISINGEALPLTP